MKENKITCDKCGKVGISAKYSIPKGWYTLTYKVSSSDYVYANTVEKDLCDICCKALGIKVKAHEDKQREDIGERLVEILSEIVGEVSNG